MKIAICFLSALIASVQLSGQAINSTKQPSLASSASASPSPDLRELLQTVQAVAQKSAADVARLRVDKWKVDTQSKQQAEANAAAISRNLADAVPDLLLRVQNQPDSLIANFRLYRNLNVLYDAFSALTESAGAFGAQDQYMPLASDIAQLDQLRRQFAERMDLLTGSGDAELARLRAAAAKTATAKKAQPTSKIVVDDNQPTSKKKPKASQTPTHPSQQ